MSLTYGAIIAGIFVKVLEALGIRIGSEQMTEFIATAGIIITGLVAAYGRWRAGGLKWFGARKPII